MKRILIVDDAMYIRNKLHAIVERIGHQVVGHAADGFEAVEKIRIHKPDVVTLDLTMPFMSGLEVLDEMKSEFPEIKFIVVTANGGEQMVREAIIKGADFFIMKPFDDEDVEKIFDILCRRGGCR